MHCLIFFKAGDILKQGLKRKYITSAFLLLVSTVIVKVISAVYKIPLTSYIGAVGRGYFSVAYNLCMPVHAITMGALPIALTKLISSYDAKGDSVKIAALRKAAKKLFFLAGFIGLAVMLMIAKPYTAIISSSPKSIYTVLALAPSVFFSCLCASHRAFAEGFLDMKPTAISQTIEALFKMIFGLLFARLSMSFLLEFYFDYGTVLGVVMANEQEALSAVYPVSSAFAMLGATFGSVVSYIFAAIYTKIKYKYPAPLKEDAKAVYNELLIFSTALVGATVVQSISNFIDTSSIQYCLSLCNEQSLAAKYSYSGDDVLSYVFGIYALNLDFRNLIPAIVMALGVTAVPAVSAAYEGGGERFSQLLTSIFKYTVILSVLGGVILASFPADILGLFYGKSNPDIVVNARQLLFLFGVTALPAACASTSVYCTQALGFAKDTIAPFAVSAVVRVGVNFALISNEDINILATAFSNFAGFLIILIWNIVTIYKKTNAKIDAFNVFFKPILCAAITYFATDYVRLTIFKSYQGVTLFILNLAFCLLFFMMCLIMTKSISLREIKSLK